MSAPVAGDPSAALESALASARAAWPEFTVPADALAVHLRSLAGDDGPANLHISDLYLAFACARGDERAVTALDRAFLAPLCAVVARAGSPPDVAAEVIQVLRARLLVRDGERPPRIGDYAGRGPLSAWLRIAALREASKVRRHERAQAGLQPDPPSPGMTPEDAAVLARYGQAFHDAFRDAFQGLPAEDRLLLRLHFAEGLNLDGLASTLGFSRATAGRRVLAARTRLREETARLLGERLSASGTEVQSVLVALRSWLEVSLGALVSAA